MLSSDGVVVNVFPLPVVFDTVWKILEMTCGEHRSDIELLISFYVVGYSEYFCVFMGHIEILSWFIIIDIIFCFTGCQLLFYVCCLVIVILWMWIRWWSDYYCYYEFLGKMNLIDKLLFC